MDLSGAKTVPRKSATRKIPCKTSDIPLILIRKTLREHRKTLFRYREGGRTVGSGRVATIIE